MIAIKSHNIIDYCLAAGFALAPFVFGFDGVYFAQDVFTAVSVAILGYSLLTDYDFSMVRTIPLGMHRILDWAVGLLILGAPWIYGYQELLTPLQSAVHWAFGLGTIGVAALTDHYPRVVEKTVEQQPIAHERVERPRRAA